MFDKYQAAVLEAIKNGCSVAVNCTAGSGKSTVGIAAAKNEIKSGGKAVMLAFNTDVASELNAKYTDAAFHAATFNSFGARRMPHKRKLHYKKWEVFFKQFFNLYVKPEENLVVSSSELRNIQKNFPPQRFEERFLESLGEEDEREPKLNISAWNNALVNNFGNEEDLRELYKAVESVTRYMSFDNQISDCQFSNEGITLLIIDEAQDITLAKLSMINRIWLANNKPKVLLLGDINQTIYEWAGAKVENFGLAAKMFNCVALPMSVTYRCPEEVVKIASAFTDKIECGNGRKGKVSYIKKGDIIDVCEQETDQVLVLARKNASLIAPYFSAIRRGIPCLVKGKDITYNVKGALSRFAGINWLEDFFDHINTIKDKEKQERFLDLFECLSAVKQELERKDKDSVIEALSKIFSESEKNPHVIFSTIHKMKGNEFNVVVIINHSALFAKAEAAKQSTEKGELFTAFVAVTRAKDTLYLA